MSCGKFPVGKLLTLKNKMGGFCGGWKVVALERSFCDEQMSNKVVG